MNSDLFLSLLLLVSHCPDCVSAVNIVHLPSKMGLAHFFELRCVSCEWKIKFCSSKQCSRTSDSSERHSYEINKRAIISFRENGLGFNEMSTFCRCMNMPPPMAQTTFDDLNSVLHNSYVETAQESMDKAGKAVYAKSNDIGKGNTSMRNVSVSGDGAWQKRGFSSLNGVMTLISSGKCVDVEVLSKKCKQCERWEGIKEAPEYLQWKETHICSMNHSGSSGGMEVVGMKKMFHRSERLHKLQYAFYIGDGDTKSFDEICRSNPYPGQKLTKSECIGHVQKRVGARLRTIKSNHVGKKLSDGKSIGRSKGRLTDKVMNTLQNHYGITQPKVKILIHDIDIAHERKLHGASTKGTKSHVNRLTKKI